MQGALTTDWWHGFETLLSLRLPDLVGKTVLDVSAFDGYFAFVAERFGASRVVAVDAHGRRRPGGTGTFQRTKDALDSRVEVSDVEMHDIATQTVGKFDVVLFLGALELARDQLSALEAIAGVTEELLVVETRVDTWGPNRAAVVAMLHSVGFKEVVPYPVRRFSIDRLVGLPARAKSAIELVSATPWRSRERVIRDLARSALLQSRLVAHGRI